MSTAKKTSGARKIRERETWGTRAAAVIRAECNQMTRAQRQALLERAMHIAYGAETQPAKSRRR